MAIPIEEGLLKTFLDVLTQIAREIIASIPNILIAVGVLAIAFLAIRLLNFFLRKLLKIVELDKMLKQISGISLPFSLNSLVIYLADIGIALIALFAIANLFLEAQQIELMVGALNYAARIVSIGVVTLFLFAIFSVAIDKVRIETRLRGYAFFIILLIITAMIIDVTALTDSAKSALMGGLAIGIGISIGVFAVWFFFSDIIDRLVERKGGNTGNSRIPNSIEKS